MSHTVLPLLYFPINFRMLLFINKQHWLLFRIANRFHLIYVDYLVLLWLYIVNRLSQSTSSFRIWWFLGMGLSICFFLCFYLEWIVRFSQILSFFRWQTGINSMFLLIYHVNHLYLWVLFNTFSNTHLISIDARNFSWFCRFDNVFAR